MHTKKRLFHNLRIEKIFGFPESLDMIVTPQRQTLGRPQWSWQPRSVSLSRGSKICELSVSVWCWHPLGRWYSTWLFACYLCYKGPGKNHSFSYGIVQRNRQIIHLFDAISYSEHKPGHLSSMHVINFHAPGASSQMSWSPFSKPHTFSRFFKTFLRLPMPSWSILDKYISTNPNLALLFSKGSTEHRRLPIIDGIYF